MPRFFLSCCSDKQQSAQDDVYFLIMKATKGIGLKKSELKPILKDFYVELEYTLMSKKIEYILCELQKNNDVEDAKFLRETNEEVIKEIQPTATHRVFSTH